MIQLTVITLEDKMAEALNRIVNEWEPLNSGAYCDVAHPSSGAIAKAINCLKIYRANGGQMAPNPKATS
jgi:hypothetical protein